MSNIIEDFDWENKTWDVIDTFFKQENLDVVADAKHIFDMLQRVKSGK